MIYDFYSVIHRSRSYCAQDCRNLPQKGDIYVCTISRYIKMEFVSKLIQNLPLQTCPFVILCERALLFNSHSLKASWTCELSEEVLMLAF